MSVRSLKIRQLLGCLIIPAATLGGVYGLESNKFGSVMVDAEMRQQAARNIERFEWAQARRDALVAKLGSYLELSAEALWAMPPSQGMPRSSMVVNGQYGPPGVGERHFEAPAAISRGWGRGFHYHIDPFEQPWKIQCRASGEWFPSNDFAAYYASSLDSFGLFELGRGDPRHLTGDGDGDSAGWVDDGTGVRYDGRLYFFAAHYAFRLWFELMEVVEALAELYSITDDPAYAHRAGILLDRMADIYPQMDYAPWFRLGMESSSGGSGKGRVMGCIWETWVAQKLATAYDLIFDALIVDQDLADFASERLHQAALDSGLSAEDLERDAQWQRKSTPGKVAAHIEQNLLGEFVLGMQDGRIRGNDGMHQHAMAAVAVALDDPDTSPELIEWLFEPTGGDMVAILTNRLNRDGRGIEQGLGYSMIPVRSIHQVVAILRHYDGPGNRDLFAEFPKLRRAMRAGEFIRVLDDTNFRIGDGGAPLFYGSYGDAVPPELALLGYRQFGDEAYLKELWFALRGNPEALTPDIYSPDPESELAALRERLRVLMAEAPPFESFVASGYGLAVLQAPNRDSPRAVGINFGPMGWGHGHGDRLGLHYASFGAKMMADLGYPTAATANNLRIGWESHTASHNTVMIDDQRMQPWSTFSGRTQLFCDAGPIRVMDIDGLPENPRGLGHSTFYPQARPIYPQANTYRRFIAMIDVDENNSYAVDVFWVRGGRKHRLMQNGGGGYANADPIGWVAQAEGTLAGENIAFGEVPGGRLSWRGETSSGLMFLDNVERAGPIEAPFAVTWPIVNPYASATRLDNVFLRVHNLTEVDEVALADGPTPGSRRGIEKIRYLSRLRVAADPGEALASQFITIHEAFQGEAFIEKVQLLEEGETADGFYAVIAVSLKDGRTDLLAVTEHIQQVNIGDIHLNGRVGWTRLHADGQTADQVLIEGTQFNFAKQELSLPQPAWSGKVSATDTSDPAVSRVKLTGDPLPETVRGQYILFDHAQRSDGAFKVEHVLKPNEISLGDVSLQEMLVDAKNPAAGAIYIPAPGDQWKIARMARLTNKEADHGAIQE